MTASNPLAMIAPLALLLVLSPLATAQVAGTPYETLATSKELIVWKNDKICSDFGGHGGHDLAQVVFFRPVGNSEANSYKLDLTGSHPSDIMHSGADIQDRIIPIKTYNIIFWSSRPRSCLQ